MFLCPPPINRCKHRFMVKVEAEGDGGSSSGVCLPQGCPSPGGACPGTNFLPVPDCPCFTNYQVRGQGVGWLGVVVGGFLGLWVGERGPGG